MVYCAEKIVQFSKLLAKHAFNKEAFFMVLQGQILRPNYFLQSRGMIHYGQNLYKLKHLFYLHVCSIFILLFLIDKQFNNKNFKY